MFHVGNVRSGFIGVRASFLCHSRQGGASKSGRPLYFFRQHVTIYTEDVSREGVDGVKAIFVVISGASVIFRYKDNGDTILVRYRRMDVSIIRNRRHYNVRYFTSANIFPLTWPSCFIKSEFQGLVIATSKNIIPSGRSIRVFYVDGGIINSIYK